MSKQTHRTIRARYSDRALPSMAGLIARHQCEDLSHDRVGLLEAAAQLLVQQEAGELCSARSLEELNEDFASGALDLICRLLKGGRPDEVSLIVVCLELVKECLELSIGEVGVDLLVEKLHNYANSSKRVLT